MRRRTVWLSGLSLLMMVAFASRVAAGAGVGVGSSIDVETINPVTLGDQARGAVFPVKFVCGRIVPADTLFDPAVPAGVLWMYQTAINIVNPAGKRTDFEKRATQTLPQNPENVRGVVGSPVTETLSPYEGLEIDCKNIRGLLGNPPGEFLKGFVLIETAQPLSVVAVYTVKTVEGDPGMLEAPKADCKKLGKAAYKLKKLYLEAVDDFRKGEKTCAGLLRAWDRAEEAIDECRKQCDWLFCPSKPLAPGCMPGTKQCDPECVFP